MTVYLVISLPNIPYIYTVYIYTVLANPMHEANVDVLTYCT